MDLCPGLDSGPLLIHADVSERPPNCTRRSPITYSGLQQHRKWSAAHVSAVTDAVRLIYICRARVRLCKHTMSVSV